MMIVVALFSGMYTGLNLFAVFEKFRVDKEYWWHDYEEYVKDCTRKFSWFRYLNPHNVIGVFLGYCWCRCGNNWWKRERVTVYTSFREGKIICRDCYEAFKDKVDEMNRKITT